MRTIVSLLLSLCAMTCMAQSFLGVKYGTPFKKAIVGYQAKYGSSCEDAGQDIVITTPEVAGVVFDVGIAFFSVVKGVKVLDGGVLFLEKPAYEKSSLIGLQERLIEALTDKYGDDVRLSTDENGDAMLSFGKRLTPNKKWLGSVCIVEKPERGICALVLNYSRFHRNKTSDL